MSFFDAINVAASGLTAERTAMDVTTENLANANTTNVNGQPYKPQAVELSAIGDSSFAGQLSSALAAGGTSPTAQALLGANGGGTAGGVEVSQIVTENVPYQLVYNPSSPQANAQGYVREPNVQPVTEMTNLIDESNSYQADVTAMETAKTMYQATLGVLK
ncbi:flagellar basal body rod protein FlgC [Conexibacter sp. DBS9H8]|uniref:flagellar basal body rod protein FlgC n=1 Tax=Conexibacter sp. DBS9H8 TaxID=2937801 RepID=UPI00200C3EE1|nr:flagellar basal body rod protein FlgC [Conexibacter sp. DBS9H8]